MKKNILIILLIAAASLNSGCETVKGVGRDIELTSSAVQKSVFGGEKAAEKKPSWFK